MTSSSFPVSPAQRHWLDRLDQPGVGRALVTTRAFRVRGPLSLAALRTATTLLVARHEPLRTSFPRNGAGALQEVFTAGRLPVELVDLSAHAGSELRAIRRIADLPIDPATDPMTRMTVLRLGEGDHLLVAALHLFVADAASLGVFFRDLGALYAAELGGMTANLPALAVQYVDWTVWRLGQFAAQRRIELASWWEQALRGARWGLPLASGSTRSGRGHLTRRPPLPCAVADSITKLARQSGTTTYAVLLAACGLTVSQQTGHDRIVLLVPTSDRDQVEMPDALGLFAELVPVCVDVSGHLTPGKLAIRAGSALFAALAHKALPIDEITKNVAALPVIFSYRPFDRMGVLDLPGCVVTDVPIDFVRTKIDLTVFVEETSAGPAVGVEFDDGLIGMTEASEIAAVYEEVLCEFVKA